MKISLHQVDAIDPIQCDVCIIGGGIAGLVLARALIHRKIHVTLLEAGDLVPTQQSTDVYRTVQHVGRFHTGTREGRFRVLGGSSTKWGGQLLPYPDEVFEDWCVQPEEVYGFIPEIESIMGCNHHPYDRSFAAEFAPKALLDVPDWCRIRHSKFAPFSNRNLANTIGPELDASPFCKIYYNANAVRMDGTDDRRAISRVICRDYEQREVAFEAKQVVLTTGTIEASRLLLASDETACVNANQQVGRHFHDHLRFVAGQVEDAANSTKWIEAFAPRFLQQTLHPVKLEVVPEVVASKQWCDVMSHFTIESDGTAMEKVRQCLRLRQQGKPYFSELVSLVASPSNVVDAMRVVSEAKIRHRRVPPKGGRVDINIEVEQVSTPGNRIELTERRDSFGMPTVKLNWNISDVEIRTISEFYELLKSTWRPAWGNVNWEVMNNGLPIEDRFVDVYHMMGGTVMGTDPATSVVDSNLKVHGKENLFVASCSTFPSGGSSNPTLTLMCLCLRLAQHLAQGRNEIKLAN
ncbi:FAD-dependent oxidoreductase [Planctomicrobium sp. SH668]|uniref:FAD-dependent oxidoreductase n=1 Tax=Planctomicrobium sp. SH668 TaxID=3448126 RepID=UPI003F5B2A6F